MAVSASILRRLQADLVCPTLPERTPWKKIECGRAHHRRCPLSLIPIHRHGRKRTTSRQRYPVGNLALSLITHRTATNDLMQPRQPSPMPFTPYSQPPSWAIDDQELSAEEYNRRFRHLVVDIKAALSGANSMLVV